MNITRDISVLLTAAIGPGFPGALGKRRKQLSSDKSTNRFRRICRIESLERRELLAVDAFSNMSDFDSSTASSTIGIYNPNTSSFYLKNSITGGNSDIGTCFGAPGWIGLIGDWDGDGKDTIGVYNPNTSSFYLNNSITGGNGDIWACFGAPGWKPIVGDWDGDGKDTIGVYNPNTSSFYLNNSITGGNGDTWACFGAPGWKPIVGDWDGDGKDTIGVYNPNTSSFYLNNSITGGNGDSWACFGAPGWNPIVGDWDGDGKDTIGVYNPNTSFFYLNNSITGGNGNIMTCFGGANWMPIAGNWLNQTDIKDAELANVFKSLTVDGSICRNDMIQLLRTPGSDNDVVDATELTDLRNILANAAAFQIPDYVQILAGNILNGNQANAMYQGESMGNLTAGSTASHMTKLVDKWFLGADHPESEYTYKYFSGSLFVDGPAYSDSGQGYLGDCYFIASMDAMAMSSPTAIQNMFVDNGDNTWTVRFYCSNNTADYITVDRYLPSYANYAIYADVRGNYTNSDNELWMALGEKAYTQWNETGKEGRDGSNSYASIEGGWMQNVCQQVLGSESQVYWGLKASDKQYLINALAANKAVTYATKTTGSDNGLVGNHAYMVSSYDHNTDTFQLYNPWASNHPGPLTYAQLRTNGQGFVVASTSGSVPINTLNQGVFAPPAQELLPDIVPLDKTLTAALGNVMASHVARPLLVDRVMNTALDLAGSDFDLLLTSSSRRTENTATECSLAIDTIFTWHDALHAECI